MKDVLLVVLEIRLNLQPAQVLEMMVNQLEEYFRQEKGSHFEQPLVQCQEGQENHPPLEWNFLMASRGKEWGQKVHWQLELSWDSNRTQSFCSHHRYRLPQSLQWGRSLIH